jgi:hypothetical protein
MPAAASIELDRAAVKNIFDAIKRNSKDTGRSMKSSLAWGGIKLSQSLGAQTVRSKRLRPVIENPNEAYKRDKRRARFGVMAHRQRGPAKFVPIYKTGEFGNIRFENKKTATWFTIDASGRVKKDLDTGKSPDQINGIMQSPKRVIGRRGFAAKSWKFLKMRISRGGKIYIDGKADMGEVIWSGGEFDPAVTINNRVSYMQHALKGGVSAVSNAMNAAAKGMMYQLDKNIRKKMGFKA